MTHLKIDPNRMPKPVCKYYRSRSGKVVHHWTCGVQGMTSIPMLWAGNMSADELVSEMARRPWLRPCQVCRPDMKIWDRKVEDNP